jgi:hypothetical protein
VQKRVTKETKTIIIFTTMSLRFYKFPGQVGAVLFLIGFFLGCSPEAEIDPPVTPLLSRDVLGYGVVSASYTRVLDEPANNGVALGYVRERTILRVLERRLVRNGESSGYWLLTEGTYRGWLPESVIDIYDNEGKAQTAAAP